ncbi:MAG: hypothetical protein JWM71_2206, partial [Solirubrobacteraceae bacterium]|nr:hypothetical protein [Solirubrobacteraceae bacterium]
GATAVALAHRRLAELALLRSA